ncbi:MAG: hypothetical protein KBE91_05715 [Bacteroidia bacterium]|nr:hypothetical protein [Bacteroidia bacterium]MBP9689091.1 hypothetical protein [Bacteroidia bacterium]
MTSDKAINTIKVYTDGSCHTQQKCGAWASIILIGSEEVVIKNTEVNTTHNRMELQAIINAVIYLKNSAISFDKIEVYTDSQYAVNLLARNQRLLNNNYLTKKGTSIQNTDLVQALIKLYETTKLTLIKVAAHQQANVQGNYNRKVDMIVRALMRETVQHG